MITHRNFSDGANVVLIKQPDFVAAYLLRFANANGFSNTNTTLTQEFTRWGVDAEGVIKQIVTELVSGNKLCKRWVIRCFSASRLIFLRRMR